MKVVTLQRSDCDYLAPAFFSPESLYEIIDENGNAEHDCD